MPSFSLASTLGGLTTPFGLNPEKTIYLPPAAGEPSLDGEATWTDIAEGRDLYWSWLSNNDWTTLWGVSGGDGATSARGYVRCVDWGGYGTSDRWGDYSCVIHRPAKGEFWVDSRMGFTLRLTDMLRVQTAS
ncbi:MAG: hypothetical protein U0556_09870 [Dehalococcoidia bacterium]